MPTARIGISTDPSLGGGSWVTHTKEYTIITKDYTVINKENTIIPIA